MLWQKFTNEQISKASHFFGILSLLLLTLCQLFLHYECTRWPPLQTKCCTALTEIINLLCKCTKHWVSMRRVSVSATESTCNSNIYVTTQNTVLWWLPLPLVLPISLIHDGRHWLIYNLCTCTLQQCRTTTTTLAVHTHCELSTELRYSRYDETTKQKYE